MQSPKCPLTDVSPGAWRAGPGKETPVRLPAQLGLERTQGSPSAARNKKQLPPSPSPSPAPTRQEKKWEEDTIPPSSCTGLAPAKKEESSHPGEPPGRSHHTSAALVAGGPREEGSMQEDGEPLTCQRHQQEAEGHPVQQEGFHLPQTHPH